jgi:hypothetical protein
MAVKVEMARNEDKGIVALAFECSKAEEHEILDAIRVAMFGDWDKQCGYVHSNRLVVHIKVDNLNKG